MNGSRTIRVIKRDGCQEAFDAPKLAVAMYRGMLSTEGKLDDATQLAAAIRAYLARTGRERVSSTTLMEMALRVLRRVDMAPAATAMEVYAAWRDWRRRQIRIRHECGEITLCDKSWLSEIACRSWNLSLRAGRIMASQVERDLLAGGRSEFSRAEIQDMLNARVAEFGLADAVPVERDSQPV